MEKKPACDLLMPAFDLRGCLGRFMAFMAFMAFRAGWRMEPRAASIALGSLPWALRKMLLSRAHPSLLTCC